MAKTIEERAKEAIHNHYACNGEYPCSSFDYCKFGSCKNTAYNCEECGADEFENGYHIGCKDQRKIDIDKACKWLDSSPLSDYLSCEMIEDFKKAMEE